MFESDYANYSSICQQAVDNDEMFKTFKDNPVYRSILEHVNVEQAQVYLSLISTNEYFNQIPWDKIFINDTIGSPQINNFIVNNKEYNVSPSNFRYVHFGLEILKNLKQCNNNTPNIIEIGGGYGGQCYIIYLLAPLYGIKIKSYTILDLPSPVALANKFISTISPDINAKAYVCSNVDITYQSINYLVSNYAYSELDKNTRDVYAEKVLSKTAAGYLAWNTAEPLDSFFSTVITKITEEVPKTSPNNFIVTYASSQL